MANESTPDPHGAVGNNPLQNIARYGSTVEHNFFPNGVPGAGPVEGFVPSPAATGGGGDSGDDGLSNAQAMGAAAVGLGPVILGAGGKLLGSIAKSVLNDGETPDTSVTTSDAGVAAGVAAPDLASTVSDTAASTVSDTAANAAQPAVSVDTVTPVVDGFDSLATDDFSAAGDWYDGTWAADGSTTDAIYGGVDSYAGGDGSLTGDAWVVTDEGNIDISGGGGDEILDGGILNDLLPDDLKNSINSGITTLKSGVSDFMGSIGLNGLPTGAGTLAGQLSADYLGGVTGSIGAEGIAGGIGSTASDAGALGASAGAGMSAGMSSGIGIAGKIAGQLIGDSMGPIGGFLSNIGYITTAMSAGPAGVAAIFAMKIAQGIFSKSSVGPNGGFNMTVGANGEYGVDSHGGDNGFNSEKFSAIGPALSGGLSNIAKAFGGTGKVTSGPAVSFVSHRGNYEMVVNGVESRMPIRIDTDVMSGTWGEEGFDLDGGYETEQAPFAPIIDSMLVRMIKASTFEGIDPAFNTALNQANGDTVHKLWVDARGRYARNLGQAGYDALDGQDQASIQEFYTNNPTQGSIKDGKITYNADFKFNEAPHNQMQWEARRDMDRANMQAAVAADMKNQGWTAQGNSISAQSNRIAIATGESANWGAIDGDETLPGPSTEPDWWWGSE